MPTNRRDILHTRVLEKHPSHSIYPQSYGTVVLILLETQDGLSDVRP